jgi:hypothetical protein
MTWSVRAGQGRCRVKRPATRAVVSDAGPNPASSDTGQEIERAGGACHAEPVVASPFTASHYEIPRRAFKPLHLMGQFLAEAVEISPVRRGSCLYQRPS